jgi:hypothetical protein
MRPLFPLALGAPACATLIAPHTAGKPGIEAERANGKATRAFHSLVSLR